MIPGDILQFRDHAVTTVITTRTTFADGTSDTSESIETQIRPHHTAIVDANRGLKALVIFEQNRNPGLPVERNTLVLANGVFEVKTEHHNVKGPDGKSRAATIVTTTSCRVAGAVKAYRPQPIP